MSSFIPQFLLYGAGGLGLIYTFTAVQKTNAPQDPVASIVHKITRGKGALIIDGGEESWELEIEGILTGEDYEDLVVKMDAMTAAIVKFNPYVLKIGKTISTNYEYKVKRISPIEWGETDYRNDYIFYKIVLIVYS